MSLITANVESVYASALRSDVLSLMLYPTEQCNFRCVYCYEDFSVGRMHPDVVQGVKNLIVNRSNDLSQLNVSWFGGEPLAAADIIFDVMQFVLTQSQMGGFSYSSSITTNGWFLTRDVLDRLISMRVSSFQISLDGPRQTHDARRLRANGSGTFDTIMKNIRDMHRSSNDFVCTLRLHFTADNVEEIGGFAESLSRTLDEDKRFRFFFKDIVRLGGANDSSIKPIPYAQKKHMVDALYSRVPSSMSSQDALRGKEQYICYASKPNFFAIRADGTVQKCTVALNNKHNALGRINLDGSMTIDKGKMLLWSDGFVTGVGATLGCPWTKVRQLQ